MTQIDMSKLDIRRLNIGIDRLMEVTTNPRHRLMLQAFYRHRFLELAGRYEEIFTPDMMVESPLYRFSYGGPPTTLAGTDAVKDQYSKWAREDETIFYNENEQIAVADNFIAAVAPVALHQLHAKALIANGFDVDDENAYYLHRSGIFDDERWQMQRGNLVRMFDNPGVVQAWRTMPMSMSPEFVTLVEEILGEEADGEEG